MRRASPNNASGRPSPAPLVEGEHVLCTIKDSSHEAPIDAVVIALDKTYTAAAEAFIQMQHEQQLENDHFMLAPRSCNDNAVMLNHDYGQNVDYDPYVSSLHSFGAAHKHETVDLTNDEVDVDADMEGDAGFNEIMFHEEGKANIIHTPKQLQRKMSISPQPPPSSARSKRRLTQEVTLPPGMQAYVENGHIKPSAMPAPHPITEGRVYVHFSGKDRRLDRWVNANELERASASTVAAAASGVVENTLVDNAVQADFAVAETQAPGRKLTRSRRREYEAINPVSERETGTAAAARMERAREEMTKVRNISAIVIGEYHVDAWYYSPFPGPYGQVHTLYICKFCLKYVRTRRRYTKHCSTCTWRRPPGAEIYHDKQNDLRVYEIDGFVNTIYCQRLCLLAKLFLDHKTLYFDVAPFMFYVITLGDEIAGFFSKENSIIGCENNLACILTLPQHQRKGVGGFLISLSYELSKIDQKIGSPERPLSDLGQLSYRSYWAYSIAKFLRSREGMAGITTKEISECTAIRVTDVVSTLKDMNLIHIWKGETYADASSKSLDAAEGKISRPRLSINVRQLRSRLNRDKGSEKSSPHLAQKGANRKRPRSVAAEENPPYGKQLKRVSNVNGMPSSARQPRKSEARAIASPTNGGGGYPGTPKRGFTPEQLRRMERLVEEVTPQVVMAALNTPGGMTTSEVQEFSNTLKLPSDKVRKKLRYIAEAMLSKAKPFQQERKVAFDEQTTPRRAPDMPRRNSKTKTSPSSAQKRPQKIVPGTYGSPLGSSPQHGRSVDYPTGRDTSSRRESVGKGPRPRRPTEVDVVVVDSP